MSIEECLSLKGIVLKEEQNKAIESLLNGKDVMVVLPTGFGKSTILGVLLWLKIQRMQACLGLS